MSATPPSSGPVWAPLIYFWEGGWFGVGRARASTVPAHAHHAVQVTLGLDGPIAFREPGGEWIESPGGIVLPDAPHEFDNRGVLGMMFFLDPESHEGRWMRDSLRGPITPVALERFAPFVDALTQLPERRITASEATRLVTRLAHSLVDGPPKLRRMDERIARALAFIRSHEARGLSLDAVAREAFLSPSRFAHLFTGEVGLPFRRYLLWRKLSRALDAFSRGVSLSKAAHEAGLADSAHLTRTFYQMFGVSPTLMFGAAEFHEIPAPFDIDLPAAVD